MKFNEQLSYDELTYNEYRSSIIRASWNRCKNQHRLERSDRTKANILTGNELAAYQQSSADMLHLAGDVINSVRKVAKEGDYCVILTEPNGVAIDCHMDAPGTADYKTYGLIPGSIWDEKLIGTNGIGTSLVSRQSLTINGSEHYANNLTKFTCTAAPIFGHQGTILGCLNIARLTDELYVESYITRNFIHEAANQISATIFRKYHAHENIASLSPSCENPLYESKALLAYDGHGNITDATMDSLALLDNFTFDNLMGLNIYDLFGINPNDADGPKMKHSPLSQHPQKNIIIDLHRKTAPKKVSLKSYEEHTPTIIKPDFTQKKTRLDQLAGSDPTMCRAVNIARNFVNQNIPILIIGETGVGKDVFTSSLHKESERKDKPFVAFNCATIPESLIDSELFGYEPGTFTDGLKEGKTGKILASDQGTLFLDEIGDMPPHLQARLLRVLEEREVTRLGAVTPKKVDIRVICATHKNIPELIREGKFREDLYFRIKGVQIELPSLSERTNLSEIARHIIHNNTPYDPEKITITPEVWSLFNQYQWPGNIRELKSTILYSLTMMKDNMITIKDLPAELTQNATQQSDSNQANGHRLQSLEPQFTSNEGKLQSAQNRNEKEQIELALQQSHWNISLTARNLGISRSTLHRKMQKHQINSPHKSDVAQQDAIE